MTDSLQGAQERDPPISMKRPWPDLAASEEEKDVFLLSPARRFLLFQSFHPVRSIGSGIASILIG